MTLEHQGSGTKRAPVSILRDTAVWPGFFKNKSTSDCPLGVGGAGGRGGRSIFFKSHALQGVKVTRTGTENIDYHVIEEPMSAVETSKCLQ